MRVGGQHACGTSVRQVYPRGPYSSIEEHSVAVLRGKWASFWEVGCEHGCQMLQLLSDEYEEFRSGEGSLPCVCRGRR